MFEQACKNSESPKSWSIKVADIDQTTFGLAAENPNGGEEVKHRSPKEIMDEIAALEAVSAKVLSANRKLI